jgi:hypothetical protein
MDINIREIEFSFPAEYKIWFHAFEGLCHLKLKVYTNRLIDPLMHMFISVYTRISDIEICDFVTVFPYICFYI